MQCTNASIPTDVRYNFTTPGGTYSNPGIAAVASCASPNYTGSITITCNNDSTPTGNWDVDDDCLVAGCNNSTAPAVINTLAGVGNTIYGGTYLYTCASGYSGSPAVTCNSGVWGTASGSCVPSCDNSNAPVLSSGLATLTTGYTDNNSTLSYTCNSGSPTNITATCNAGTWSGLSGYCNCSNASLSQTDYIFGTTTGTTLAGDVAPNVSCDPASAFVGTPDVTCSATGGIWNYSGCGVPVLCNNADAPTLANATRTTTGTTSSGSSLSYACNSGYAGSPSVICTAGAWGSVSGSCSANPCNNSSLTYTNATFNTSGTTLAGSTVNNTGVTSIAYICSVNATCNASGTGAWSYSGSCTLTGCTAGTYNIVYQDSTGLSRTKTFTFGSDYPRGRTYNPCTIKYNSDDRVWACGNGQWYDISSYNYVSSGGQGATGVGAAIGTKKCYCNGAGHNWTYTDLLPNKIFTDYTVVSINHPTYKCPYLGGLPCCQMRCARGSSCYWPCSKHCSGTY
jgi:hypothetical protein